MCVVWLHSYVRATVWRLYAVTAAYTRRHQSSAIMLGDTGIASCVIKQQILKIFGLRNLRLQNVNTYVTTDQEITEALVYSG